MSPRTEGCVEERSHLCCQKKIIHFNGLIKASDSACERLERMRLLYPCSKCRRTQRSCQVRSAGSVWPSSAGAAGRRHRVSERHNGCLVSQQTGSRWCQLAGNPPPTLVLSNVISHGRLWLLSTTMCTLAGLLWNLMIWRTEVQQRSQLKPCHGIEIVKVQALTTKLSCRTSVVWNHLFAHRSSFLVKEQHSSVHIHRHCLSAGSHHLHLRIWKNAAVEISNGCGLSIESPAFGVDWLTWNEWTGSCLTLLLAFILAGVSSGTCGFGWAARLWLVTASFNAFSTFANKWLFNVTSKSRSA